jgi:hypothetical protein
MKTITPSDTKGEMLVIGDYVKYNDIVWEIVDFEDGSGKYWDDDYEEHASLLLSPRSQEGENIWIEDYEVEQTEHQQFYFEL